MKLKDAIKLIKRNKGEVCFITRPCLSKWVEMQATVKSFNVEDLLATDWQVKINGTEIK